MGGLAVAVVGGLVTLGFHERGEHQKQVHEASEQRLASFRTVFEGALGSPVVPPRENVKGCGDDSDDCRVEVAGRYSTTSIHAWASALERGLKQHNLSSTRGVFGTDSSLGTTSGKSKFTVEYAAVDDKREEVDGTSFYLSAYISCDAINKAQEIKSPFASLPGTCEAAISWSEISPADTSGGFR